MAETIKQAVARRRTFAIIAHPDAGKTTLTEKLLLFGQFCRGKTDRQGEILKQKTDGRAGIGKGQGGQIGPMPLVEPKRQERRAQSQRDRRVEQRYE